jgi:hypothetical protein
MGTMKIVPQRTLKLSSTAVHKGGLEIMVSFARSAYKEQYLNYILPDAKKLLLTYNYVLWQQNLFHTILLEEG